jgi:hypothetical protein
MKAKSNAKAERTMRRGPARRFGAKSKGAPPQLAPETLREADKKPRVILSAVILANGEEAVVKKHPNGTYDVSAESSTYWRIPEEQYTKLLPVPKGVYPRQCPRQFVRMEQGGLPSLGKRR